MFLHTERCVNDQAKLEDLLKGRVKEKDKIIAQKTQDLETLQQRHAEQSKQLDESQYIAVIYQRQLELLQTVSKAIKNMDICKLILERYCKLIEKENSTQLNDDEKDEKQRLKDDLDCNDDVTVSADYHLRIRESFQEHVKNVLQFRQAQVNLMIAGNFQKMETEQQNSKNALAETCRFICDLPESDLKSDKEETVFETGWKIFHTFFT